MARLNTHHQTLNEHGVGKCSVPMWSDGFPDGFCDKDAFGLHLFKSVYDGYVPALACPNHGGPLKQEAQ